MNTIDVLVGIIGICLAVISYFLTNTMSKLEAVIVKEAKNENDIALLKQETGLKHERLEEKLDELKDSIVLLTSEIKTLNQKH